MAYFRCGGNEKHYATISVTTDYLFGETVTCACADVGYSQTTTFSDDGEANFTVNDWGRYTITSGDHASIIDVSAWYVTYDVDFAGSMELNLTLEGAMNDTITIKDSTGATVGTCIFNNSTTGQTRITTPLTGGEYTFVSSIANATDGSSSNYSKTATLTDETTSVKVMPDGALYWYGYQMDGVTNTTLINAQGETTKCAMVGKYVKLDLTNYSKIICHKKTGDGMHGVSVFNGDPRASVYFHPTKLLQIANNSIGELDISDLADVYTICAFVGESSSNANPFSNPIVRNDTNEFYCGVTYTGGRVFSAIYDVLVLE